MQQIVTEQKVKLANLAEDIADNGLNPMDRLLVLKDKDGKFIALEGNRRTLSLKIMSNPALLSGLQIDAPLRRRFESLAARFDKKLVEPISVFEVSNRAEANEWIKVRHQGEDEGRGVVGWSSVSSARFAGSDPALQALDFVLHHPGLSDADKAAIEKKFPLTTLDRILSTPDVRALLGFEIVDGKLLTALPAEEAIKPLKKIVLDLAKKVKKVPELRLATDQTKWVKTFAKSELPDLSRRGKSARPIDEIHSPQQTPTSSTPTARKQRIADQTVVVPKGCKLNVTNPKTQAIYGELLSLKLNKFPNSIAVLMRVFFENSVDHYLEDIAKKSLQWTPPGANKKVWKSLEMKAKEVIAELVTAGTAKSAFIGVERALNDKNHPFSIDIQHAYVHNRHFNPTENELKVAWKNGQVLFEKIWP